MLLRRRKKKKNEVSVIVLGRNYTSVELSNIEQLQLNFENTSQQDHSFVVLLWVIAEVCCENNIPHVFKRSTSRDVKACVFDALMVSFYHVLDVIADALSRVAKFEIVGLFHHIISKVFPMIIMLANPLQVRYRVHVCECVCGLIYELLTIAVQKVVVPSTPQFSYPN